MILVTTTQILLPHTTSRSGHWHTTSHCLCWESKTFVVTGHKAEGGSLLEVAHIIPFALIKSAKSRKQHVLWIFELSFGKESTNSLFTIRNRPINLLSYLIESPAMPEYLPCTIMAVFYLFPLPRQRRNLEFLVRIQESPAGTQVCSGKGYCSLVNHFYPSNQAPDSSSYYSLPSWFSCKNLPPCTSPNSSLPIALSF